MKAAQEFFTPRTVNEAIEVMSKRPDCTVLAGGTDVLVKHFGRVSQIGDLVDISKIAECHGIEVGSTITIGSLTTHRQIAEHSWIKEHLPILAQAAREVGARQIQNRGTVGGNLVNASPAADLAPPLIALGAKVVLVGTHGSRQVLLEDFFTGPGRTVLNKGELLTKVLIPIPSKNSWGEYAKIGQRKALAIAVASMAFWATLSGGEKGLVEANRRLLSVAVCLGSVAPVPLRARRTEKLLKGAPLNDLPIDEARLVLEQEVSPIDDIRSTADYRREVAGALLIKALSSLSGLREVEQND